MTSEAFFKDLNLFYKNTDGKSTDYLNITKNYKEQNTEKFLTNLNNLFYQDAESYLKLKNNLITLNGTVVDIFETEMGITKIEHKNGTYFSLFNNLASDDIYDIKEEDILQTKLGDYNVFLILIDNEDLSKSDFCKELWEELNNKFGKNIMRQNLIPLKVYSFQDKVKLGDRIKISGFLTKTDFENDLKKNSHDMNYLDYYKPNLIYSIYALDLEKIKSNTLEDFTESKNLLQKVEDMFFNIFKDKLAAKLMIFSLFSNCDTKVSHEPLNFFTFNFYNLNKEEIEKVLNLLNYIKLHYTYIDINENQLKEEIFAKKNINLGIMELNKIYSGSNDIFILDETDIKVTKLSEKATRNIVRIKELIQFQKISLFFFGNQIFKFPFENTVIGFSKYRSMFNYNCKLCVEKKVEEKKEKFQIEEELNENEILKINGTITYLKKRLNEIDFKKEDLEIIEQVFVKLRKDDDKFTQDDFKFIIKLAKHLAVSNFNDFLDKETFFEAIKIREEILKREKIFMENIKNK